MSAPQEHEVHQISTMTNSPINSIDISPDGKLLAVGQQIDKDRSPTLTIMNMNTGELVDILERAIHHTGNVYRVLFAPQGNFLAYVIQSREDFQLKLYDFGRKKAKTLMQTDKPTMQRGLTFDTRGKYLLVSAREIKLLETKTYQASKTIPSLRDDSERVDNSQFTVCASLSPAAKCVAIGGVKEGQVVLYDLNKKAVVRNISGPFEGVKQISFDMSGKYVAARDYYGNGVFLWNVQTGTRYLEEVFNEEMPPIFSMRFSPSTNRLALGLVYSYVNLYDLSSGKLLLFDHPHHGRVTDVCFSPDGKLLVSAGEDHQIFIRNLTGEESE